MGEFLRQWSLDAATGAVHEGSAQTGGGLFQPQWNPGAVQSDDPHLEPFGDEATTGPVPDNIKTRAQERALRSADPSDDADALDYFGSFDSGDDDSGPTADKVVVDGGDDGGDFDDDFAGLDGDDEPQDGDFSDDSDDSSEDRGSDYGDQESTCDGELAEEDTAEERSRQVYSWGMTAGNSHATPSSKPEGSLPDL